MQPAEPFPSLKAAKIFFAVCMFATIFGMQIHPLADPDIFMRMRDGRHWLEQGLSFDCDPFAFTLAGKPMEKIEVLFCMGLYKLWMMAGFRALILAKALLLTAAFGLLAWVLYRRWENLAVAAGVPAALQFLPTLIFYFYERSYIFTYLFMALAMLLLEVFRRAKPQSLAQGLRPLIGLPLLAPLWTNLHPGFSVLFVWLGAYLGYYGWLWLGKPGDITLRFRVQALGLVTAAAFLAGAFNPLGFGIYTFVFQHMGTGDFMRFIMEWNAPQWPQHADFFIFLALVWLVQLVGWRQWFLPDLLCLGVFSVMALQSYRHIPLAIWAALPATVSQVRMWAQTSITRHPRRRLWPWLAGGSLALVALAMAMRGGRAGQLKELPDYYPKSGVAWLEQHPCPGRWFTPIDWGGYLGWKLKAAYQVFMDGRLMLFQGQVFEDCLDIATGMPGQCTALLDQYNVEGILTNSEDPTGHENHLRLFSRLEESGQWALVYWDHVCQIYLRREGNFRELVKQYEYRALAPWKPTPYQFAGKDPAKILQEIKRAQLEAPDSYLPCFFEGQFWMGQDRFEKAYLAFQQAILRNSRSYSSYFNLGFCAWQLGRREETFSALQHALALRPNSKDRQVILEFQASILRGR